MNQSAFSVRNPEKIAVDGGRRCSKFRSKLPLFFEVAGAGSFGVREIFTHFGRRLAR
jgi:hypothetical protein